MDSTRFFFKLQGEGASYIDFYNILCLHDTLFHT
jgi:hypothetical protein